MADDHPRGDWLTTNRANWNDRVPIHLEGPFYDVEGWRAGRDNLEPFELEEVGDVSGRQMVHLQCHFGLDTLSWARRGAQITGLDFSAPAIEAARRLAQETGIDARFVCADVYSAPEALGATYDIVYTSHGVLGWLPDLQRWAEVVDALLRPGGFLYLSEYHPVSWCLAQGTPERRLGDLPEHDYFHAAPLELDEPGTYSDPQAHLAHTRTVEFQHTLGEIVSVLCGRGLQLAFLRERDFTHFPQLDWLIASPEDRRWIQPPDRPRVPLLFSLRAHKPA